MVFAFIHNYLFIQLKDGKQLNFTVRFNMMSGTYDSFVDAAGLIPVEATFSYTGDGRYIGIIRDVSDRVALFETEKRLAIAETTMKKDLTMNNFIKHEIKNSLLAIELNLQSAQELLGLKSKVAADDSLGEADANQLTGVLEKCKSDITSTLRIIYNEAIAKEITHGIYNMKVENVSISKLVNSLSSYRLQHDKTMDDIPPLYAGRVCTRHITCRGIVTDHYHYIIIF